MSTFPPWTLATCPVGDLNSIVAGSSGGTSSTTPARDSTVTLRELSNSAIASRRLQAGGNRVSVAASRPSVIGAAATALCCCATLTAVEQSGRCVSSRNADKDCVPRLAISSNPSMAPASDRHRPIFVPHVDPSLCGWCAGVIEYSCAICRGIPRSRWRSDCRCVMMRYGMLRSPCSLTSKRRSRCLAATPIRSNAGAGRATSSGASRVGRATRRGRSTARAS